MARFTVFEACIFTVLITSVVVLAVDMGYCPTKLTQTFETECISCAINAFIDCPNGSDKLTTREGTPGCTYEMHLGPGPNITKDGCTHTCKLTIMEDQCCKGFWGPKCDECPGGFKTACNGHGTCSDLINGTGECSCEDGWTGYACELCANSSSSGNNCTQASLDDLCANVTCPNNSECVVIDNAAICMCKWPYIEHNTTSTDNTSIVCKEINACTLPPLCHSNATCSVPEKDNDSRMKKNCTCKDGYHGDGYQCDPVNPCQVNNGGCDNNTSDCNYVGPGKSVCDCKDGYENHILDVGCSLIDVCYSSTCHAKATCTTVSPNKASCECNAGYQGDGHVCYANIVQTIRDLDEGDDPELKGQMSLIQGAIEKYYLSELTSHAFLTIFVPTNTAFRSLKTVNYREWLNDKVTVRHILRQHIVVGYFTLDKLANHTTVFHTLQGRAAELVVTWQGDRYKFRLFGSSSKAKLVRGDILASNGVIHVVNKLMQDNPDSYGDIKASIYDNIRRDGKFNRFETLIARCGSEVTDILENENVTLFAPTNTVIDKLPVGSLDYLQSDEGREHLITFVKNHIVAEVMEITDLINIHTITSIAKIKTWIYVTSTGQFQTTGGTFITRADIVASNGYIQEIDGVFLSDEISILPNKCPLIDYKEVIGPCGDCREEGRCFPPDEKLNTTIECKYLQRNAEGKYVKKSGCALMCNRTYVTPKCCDGFYGFDCLPCPNGHKNPCNGNGKCDEGYYGDGTCECNENFTGDICDTCTNDRYFGPNCSQETFSMKRKRTSRSISVICIGIHFLYYLCEI